MSEVERPLTYVDKSEPRELVIFPSRGAEEYDDEAIEAIEGFVGRIAEVDETVLEVEVSAKNRRGRGRLAVSMVVSGTHAGVHEKAQRLTALIQAGNGDSLVGAEWQTEH